MNEGTGKAAEREGGSQGTKPTFLVWAEELEPAKEKWVPNIFSLYNREWQMVPTVYGKSCIVLLFRHFHGVLAYSYQAACDSENLPGIC